MVKMKRRKGYMNVYAAGGTSKLCSSRKVADNAAKLQIKPRDVRYCLWLIEYDQDGSNPTIRVEPV